MSAFSALSNISALTSVPRFSDFKSRSSHQRSPPFRARCHGQRPHIQAQPVSQTDHHGARENSYQKPSHTSHEQVREGPFVQFWRHYDRENEDATRTFLQKRVRETFSVIKTNPQAAVYWSFSFGKVFFFSTLQTSLSVLQMLEKFIQKEEVLTSFTNLGWITMIWNAFDQDLSRIQAGLYKMPWDYNVRNPQYRISLAVGNIFKFAREARTTVKRARNGNLGDVWLKGSMYPLYYDTPYHFQTDGWLSSSSAELYDMSTEFVFYGGQDAMQRITLIPMAEYFRKMSVRNSLRPKVVEVAAGTGRFSTFVRDNWPEIDLTISDLSPFYLQKARKAMQTWEKIRGHTSHNVGPLRYLQANAENLPLKPNSVDIVYSVYLFHELPLQARRNVISEAARILKKGGLLIITDSIQNGDMVSSKQTFKKFSNFGDPWFLNYVDKNLIDLGCENGMFLPWMEEICLVSKTVAFLKK